MNSNHQREEPAQLKAPAIQVFVDGAGARPDGKGSGFAWLRKDTGEKKIVREDRLTNNQAEYRAILAAVEYLPEGSRAEVFSDSENTCCQLNGQRRVLDPTLGDLHARISELIERKKLAVIFRWIPRRENLAGKLI